MINKTSRTTFSSSAASPNDTGPGTSAIALRAQGFRVFPLYEPTGEDQCSCSKGDSCSSTAKHPRLKAGFKDASTDRRQIEAWWRKWPTANIGIATGDGLVVVDLDGPTGEESAASLNLPATVEAHTGRGRHLYYRGDAPTRQHIAPGIDIRGTGGYVVAPPSKHASGTYYVWIRDPWTHDIGELPEWVREAKTRTAGGPKAAPGAGKQRVTAARRLLTERQRNNELFLVACFLASGRLHEDEIAAALQVRKHACCQPLTHDEVEQIACSAAQNPGVRLSDAVLLDRNLNPHSTVKVYLAIRALADHQGVCIASYEGLAERAGVSRMTVSTAVSELKDKQLIRVKSAPPPKIGKPRLANIYTLLDRMNNTTAVRNPSQ